MNDKDEDDEENEVRCEEVNKKGRTMTEQEKKECEFILKNLVRIWKMGRRTNSKEKADIRMKEHLYCIVLNMWLHEYWDVHCEAKHVMNSAYDTMNNLCQAFNKGKNCTECKYGTFKSLKVNKMEMFGYIYDAVKKERTIMSIINSRGSKKDCPKQKNAVSTVHDLNINSIITMKGGHPPTRTTRVQQRPLQSRLGQSRMAQTRPSNGEEIWKQIIRKWFTDMRRYPKINNIVNDKIWGRMQEIFNNLMGTIKKGEQEIIRRTCETGMYTGGENITPWEDKDKELCKAMMKVVLYTNGLTQDLAVIQHVSGMVGGWVGTHLMERTDEKCSRFSVQNARIGGKLISKTIGDWIETGGWKKNEKVEKYDLVMGQAQSCNGEGASERGRKDTAGGEEENEEQKDIEEKVSGIKEIMKKGETLSQTGADKVVKKIEEKKLTNDSEIMEALEKEVEEEIKEEKKAQGATLSRKESSAEDGQLARPPPQLQASSLVSTSNDQVTPPKVTDPCSSTQSNPEEQQKREASEQKGKELRAAWEEKKQKVWTPNGQLNQGEIEKDVKEMLEELKDYMVMKEQNTWIPQICGDLNHSEGKNKTNQIKGICKSLVKVIYWIEGRSNDGKSWKKEKGKKEGWDKYTKCVIGHTVILKIIEDKCDIKQVLSILSQAMQGTAQKFPKGKNGMDCDWVQESDIRDGRTLMGVQIDEWFRKATRNRNGVKGLDNIKEWMKCGPQGKEQEKREQEQKGSCNRNRIIDLLGAGRSSQLRDLVNTDHDSQGKKANMDPEQKEGKVAHNDRMDGIPDINEGFIDSSGSGPKNVLDGIEQLTFGNAGPIIITKSVTPDIPIPPYIGVNNNSGLPTAGSGSAAAGDPVVVSSGESGGPISPGGPDDPARGGGGGTYLGGSHKDTVSTGITQPNGQPQQPQSPPAIGGLIVSKIDNLSDHLTPYLPIIPVLIGTSVISYLIWKHFFLGKRRKRYRRAHHVSGPPTVDEPLLDHVDDQDDGPHEYTLIKERKPRSTPKKRRKKRGVGRRAGRRGVGHRTIIDIHLEVLDECQKGDLYSTKEDFFEILVREFMGSEFIKEENIPKEQVPREQVPSSDCGFREEDFSS
ncbi:SICA antigen [Plasmodium coatneyi]|uniref:SICA antigen n=1 Tax=Plasmodium coatneyi TaxID=208452 RepID=A0A1B1DY46_9APIC|nr:SICA antigen [Plasmodium coatneyi]ANQ07706.1 SICA antigen [Plasmodium coatneyi]